MMQYGVPISFCLNDTNSAPTCISKFLMKVHHMYRILSSKRQSPCKHPHPFLMILWFTHICVTHTNGCVRKRPPQFLLARQFQAPMGAYSREYGTHINPIQKLVTDLVLKQIHVSWPSEHHACCYMLRYKHQRMPIIANALLTWKTNTRYFVKPFPNHTCPIRQSLNFQILPKTWILYQMHNIYAFRGKRVNC